MKPIIYEKTSRTFGNDYIGILIDAISCTVQEGRNDEYELEMRYPVDGRFYEAIQQDAIILAKPNNQDDPQPFRVYRIRKNIDMTIDVNARHIVYDLSKVTVEPFQTNGTIQDAIAGMMSHAVPACGFIFETDKTTAGKYKVDEPCSFRSLMGGTQGSLLDVYGTAEYHYDGYNIDLLQERGQNRGVVIKYGISMTDLTQEEECDKVYTAVFPFWVSALGYVQLDERIIRVGGEFSFSRIMTLDLSEEFEEKPTQAQLRTKAQAYIDSNSIGVPSVSLDVDFSGTEAEQEINLCDIVTVEFEKLKVTASAKCIELTYDVLTERVISVKLGNYKNTFIDTVVQQMNGITDYAKLRTADIEDAIQSITENENGYVLLHSSTNTGHIDEILILSGTDNLQTAQKIWRWNSAGFGYSSTGYNGSFGTAITMLGQIVADYIKTGTLRAIEINAGNGTFHVTPQGFLTALSGYIGSVATGFQIADNKIKNGIIVLYNMGLGFRNSNGEDMGYWGRTDRTYVHTDVPSSWQPGDPVPEQEIYDFWWERFISRSPGIGVVVTDKSAGMAIATYNAQAGNNSVVFRFVRSDATGDREKNAFHLYKNVYMNGHGFYGFPSKPGSSYSYEEIRSTQFEWGYINDNFLVHDQYIRFNDLGYRAGGVDDKYWFDPHRMMWDGFAPPT